MSTLTRSKGLSVYTCRTFTFRFYPSCPLPGIRAVAHVLDSHREFGGRKRFMLAHLQLRRLGWTYCGGRGLHPWEPAKTRRHP